MGIQTQNHLIRFTLLVHFMRLPEYLEALRNCSDETIEVEGRKMSRLTAEFGVYDNWPIFLDADFKRAARNLQDSGKYVFYEKHRRILRFNFVPGTVVLQVWNGAHPDCVRSNQEDQKRQLNDYRMTIMLHPYQKNKIENVSDERAIAIVIDDIGQYVMREKIPVCFPESRGWDNLKDYSRIVYYP